MASDPIDEKPDRQAWGEVVLCVVGSKPGHGGVTSSRGMLWVGGRPSEACPRAALACASAGGVHRCRAGPQPTGQLGTSLPRECVWHVHSVC